MSRIEIQNVRSTILDTDDRTLQRVKKELSVYAPGYRYTWKYKKKVWDGKVCPLDERGTFPTGLLPVVVPLIPGVKLTDIRGYPLCDFEKADVALRPYQAEAVDDALTNKLYGGWWPRGIIQVATGGGKTEIAVAMIQMTQVPTLFIVHRKDLLRQAVERLAKYGITAGQIGDGVIDTSQLVTVATVQSLMTHAHKTGKKGRSKAKVAEIEARKQKNSVMISQFLAKIEQVFVDEAHLMASSLDRGNMFVQALEMMPNAYMRWGLTATPFMRGDYSNLLMAGATGGVLFEKSSEELIDEGWLTPPEITMYKMPKQQGIPNSWPACYETGVVMNTKRNEKIIDEAMVRPAPIMILVQRIDHGHLLQLMFKEKYRIEVDFLDGNASLDERVDALNRLKSGEIEIVIGSTIWDEGLDIAEIRTMVLAGAGKSSIKNLQRLGRGLRLDEGKEAVGVVDFLDVTTRWLRNHALDRKTLWEGEGFRVREEPL